MVPGSRVAHVVAVVGVWRARWWNVSPLSPLITSEQVLRVLRGGYSASRARPTSGVQAHPFVLISSRCRRARRQPRALALRSRTANVVPGSRAANMVPRSRAANVVAVVGAAHVVAVVGARRARWWNVSPLSPLITSEQVLRRE